MYKLLLLMLVSISILAVPSIKEIEDSFDTISKRYDIPASILKAIAFEKSAWNTNSSSNSEYNKGEFGIMGLTLNTISKGTQLLNIEEEDAIIDYEVNIEIAAALIAEIKDEFFQNGIIIESTSDYAPVLEKYLSYEYKDKMPSRYFLREVYESLSHGYLIKDTINKELKLQEGEGESEELVDFSDVSLFYKKYTEINSLGDIPKHWTTHYNSRGGTTVDQIIIHIMLGSMSGSEGHFMNGTPRTSAHFLVSKKGEILQMVRLKDRAWHAGNHNSRSIGIEHEGWWCSESYRRKRPNDCKPNTQITEAEYQASAKLSRFLVAKYNIPTIYRDAYHGGSANPIPGRLKKPALRKLPGFLGHWDTNGKENCPGENFNWNHYMQLVSGQNPGPQCENQCTADEYKCDGDTLKRCYDTNNDGCVEWGFVKSCASNTCDANSRSCEFSGECNNQCDHHGQKKCSGVNVLSCVRDNNGCFIYVQDKKCNGGRVCEEGQCVEPNGRCRLGTGTYCKDDKVQHCEAGVYTVISECEFGCKAMPNGVPDRCKEPSECTPECSSVGETSCKGNKIITCTNNRGCLQKKVKTVCSSSYVCSNGQCVENGNGNMQCPQENSFTTDTNYSVIMLMLLFLSSLLIIRKTKN